MSSPIEPIPRKALRAAVRRASRLAAKREDVLSVGEGFKHKGDGYLEEGAACVKFLVREKLEEPEDPIPDTIPVRIEGKAYAVPTDIESAAGMEQQSLKCWRETTENAWGTLCCLLRINDGDFLALTAGHVLKTGQGNAVIAKTRRKQDILTENFVGKIKTEWSNLTDKSFFCDVGSFIASEIPDQLMEALPWRTLREIVPSHQLWRFFKPHTPQPLTAKLYGAESTLNIRFDALYYDPFTLKDAQGELNYAPPLLGYREYSGSLAPGYSGSAVTDASTEKLLGIHVLGNKTLNAYGLAHSVDHMLRMIVDNAAQDLRFDLLNRA